MIVSCRTHKVVNLLTSINTKNNIAHFLIGEIKNLVIKKNTISRKCESELLIISLFYASSVFNKLFNNFKIHSWLSAKEINLKILS